MGQFRGKLTPCRVTVDFAVALPFRGEPDAEWFARTPRSTTRSGWSTPRPDHAVAFREGLCVRTKDRWARTAFVLSDWQREDIVRPLFGGRAGARPLMAGFSL
jgi:hypothetical protein